MFRGWVKKKRNLEVGDIVLVETKVKIGKGSYRMAQSSRLTPMKTDSAGRLLWKQGLEVDLLIFPMSPKIWKLSRINDYKELPNTPSNLNTTEPESNTYKQDKICPKLGQDNSSNLCRDLGGGYILREAWFTDILRLCYAKEATVSEEVSTSL